MKRFKSKKWITLFVVAIVALAAVAAYGYFTNSGNGSGSATVGSSSTVSLTGTISGTLYPAGSPASVSVLVHNTGAGSQYVNKVQLGSVAVNHDSAAYIAASAAQQATWDACNVSSSGLNPAFTMADITVATDLTKDDGAAGGTDQTTKLGSLQMNDTGVSQDNCQGAPLTLNLSSN